MVKTTTATPTATFEEIFDTPPLTTTNLQPKTTNGLHTIAEITAALEKELDQEILKKVDSYDYIPWPDAVRLANRIFGVSGRDIELRESRREVVPNDKGELSQGYTSIIRITVYPSDSRPFFQDGLGFSELVFSKEKSGTDRNGNVYYVPSRALIDSSIKGSASRALLRTLVLTGETFGLSLYDKNDLQGATGAVPQSSTTSTAQSSTTHSNGTSPFPQTWMVEAVAKRFNTTQEAVIAATSGLTREQASAAYDKLTKRDGAGKNIHAPWELKEDFGGLEYIKRGAAAPSTTGTPDKLPIPV